MRRGPISVSKGSVDIKGKVESLYMGCDSIRGPSAQVDRSSICIALAGQACSVIGASLLFDGTYSASHPRVAVSLYLWQGV
jgi:hypothetical protein